MLYVFKKPCEQPEDLFSGASAVNFYQVSKPLQEPRVP